MIASLLVPLLVFQVPVADPIAEALAERINSDRIAQGWNDAVLDPEVSAALRESLLLIITRHPRMIPALFAPLTPLPNAPAEISLVRLTAAIELPQQSTLVAIAFANVPRSANLTQDVLGAWRTQGNPRDINRLATLQDALLTQTGLPQGILETVTYAEGYAMGPWQTPDATEMAIVSGDAVGYEGATVPILAVWYTPGQSEILASDFLAELTTLTWSMLNENPANLNTPPTRTFPPRNFGIGWREAEDRLRRGVREGAFFQSHQIEFDTTGRRIMLRGSQPLPWEIRLGFSYHPPYVRQLTSLEILVHDGAELNDAVWDSDLGLLFGPRLEPWQGGCQSPGGRSIMLAHQGMDSLAVIQRRTRTLHWLEWDPDLARQWLVYEREARNLRAQILPRDPAEWRQFSAERICEQVQVDASIDLYGQLLSDLLNREPR